MTPNLIPAANRAAEGGATYHLAEGGATYHLAEGGATYGCGSGTSCRVAEGDSL
jgi:hypothetical protein